MSEPTWRAIQRGLAAVDGARLVLEHLGTELLPWPEADRVHVLCLGKVAGAMSEGVDASPLAPGHRLRIEKPGGTVPGNGWDVLFGDHPVPGANSLAAGATLAEWLTALPAFDPLLVCLSGGASALVEHLIPGVTADEIADLNRQLLANGAPIQDINQIRPWFSQLKRGGMAGLAGPRPILVLAISDVPGDDLTLLGSGPFAPPQTAPDAKIFSRYGLTPPARTWAIGQAVPEHRLLANNQTAVQAVAAELSRIGLVPRAFDQWVDGPARDVAARLRAVGPVVVGGGEPTVDLSDVSQPGEGGRCQEAALAFAVNQPSDAGEFYAIATDGNDFIDAAGGRITPPIRSALNQPEIALAGHNSYPVLNAAGGILRLPRFRSNVNDVFVLVADRS